MTQKPSFWKLPFSPFACLMTVLGVIGVCVPLLGNSFFSNPEKELQELLAQIQAEEESEPLVDTAPDSSPEIPPTPILKPYVPSSPPTPKPTRIPLNLGDPHQYTS